MEWMHLSLSIDRREHFRFGDLLVFGEPPQVGGGVVRVEVFADLHVAQALAEDSETGRSRGGDGDGERLAAMAEPPLSVSTGCGPWRTLTISRATKRLRQRTISQWDVPSALRRAM